MQRVYTPEGEEVYAGISKFTKLLKSLCSDEKL